MRERHVSTTDGPAGHGDVWARIHGRLAAEDRARRAYLDRACGLPDGGGQAKRGPRPGPRPVSTRPDGRVARLSRIAEAAGIDISTVYYRAAHGWPEESWGLPKGTRPPIPRRPTGRPRRRP